MPGQLASSFQLSVSQGRSPENARATSGISDKRDPRDKMRGFLFFSTRPHSSPARFLDHPHCITESLEQATGQLVDVIS